MIALTRLSLANRLIVGLVTVAILVFGVLATRSLKQELLPSTQVPTAIMTATYPGTSPELVAKDVAEPLEQVVGGVSGVTKVRSTSSNGVAVLTIEWTYGLDSDTVVSAIRNAADSVRPQLPDATVVTVQAGSTDDIPVQVLAVSSDASLQTLAQQVDDLVSPPLTKIDGVRQVQVSGQDTTELAVTLKPAKLRKHDLTAAGVTQAIQAQALVVPAGTSYRGSTELAVQVGDSATSAAQVAAWPISSTDGPVKLGSLASISVRSIDATTVARAQGRPALSITVLKDSDADAVKISHAVAAATPNLERSLGQNAKFSVVFDQAPLIEQSIHDLTVEGILGLSFAVLIILVFLLSIRSTIITAISIPLSLLIAMIGLQVGDFSLNIFTLAALTVAVGRVVDDSIVVIENIKRRDTGVTPLTPAAIIDSVRQVAGAVTASTLTTVAVFLPVAGVSGVVGELFRPFAITVAVALTASLIVSMTIVPVLAYWFLRSARRTSGATRADGATAGAEEKVTRLQRGYLPVLGFVLRRPLITVLVAVLIFGGTMASATLLKTDFIGSAADKTTLQITQKLPVGTRLSTTSQAARKIEAVLAHNPNVTSYLSTIGQGGTNEASITFTVANTKVSDQTKSDVQAALAERTDVGDVTIGSINQSGSSSDITVTVTGDNDQDLRTSSERVQQLLAATPGLTEVTSDLAEQRPVLQVDVDRTKAAAQGFTSSDIGQAISSALRGTKVGTVVLQGESRDIMVRGESVDATPKQIAQLELPVSQRQQQKATDKATDRLQDKQDKLSDDQQAAADDQKAYADQQQADGNKAAQDAQDKLKKQRTKARDQLASTRSKLAKLKRSQPPKPKATAPTPAPTTAPGQPPAPVVVPDPRAAAASAAYQQWAQQVAQLSAAVSQAKSGVSQLDAQIKASQEQATKTAASQAKQQEFTDRQSALTDRQKKLADEQKKIADVRAKPLRVADVAKVHDQLAPSTVTHIDGTRSVTITATPVGADLGALTKTVQQKLTGLTGLPAGVTVTLGGASQDQQDAFRQLGLAMLGAIVLVFVIMVATFRSLLQPLVLLVSIPFAATGAVAGLLLTNTALGVPAMVGLLMLIGIVVTNAIVLIDLINHYRRRGSDLRSAVVDGARLRLRPIIMTATATVFALIPMGLGLTGGGAFISRPLAVVVIGGLVSSTVLTLLLVPVLYTLVERRGERKRLRALESAPAPV